MKQQRKKKKKRCPRRKQRQTRGLIHAEVCVRSAEQNKTKKKTAGNKKTARLGAEKPVSIFFSLLVLICAEDQEHRDREKEISSEKKQTAGANPNVNQSKWRARVGGGRRGRHLCPSPLVGLTVPFLSGLFLFCFITWISRMLLLSSLPLEKSRSPLIAHLSPGSTRDKRKKHEVPPEAGKIRRHEQIRNPESHLRFHFCCSAWSFSSCWYFSSYYWFDCGCEDDSSLSVPP